MDFYLVKDIGPFQYDTVRSAVIYAESSAVAKAMFEEKATKDSAFGGGPLWAGRLEQGSEPRIIHTHFAAG